MATTIYNLGKATEYDQYPAIYILKNEINGKNLNGTFIVKNFTINEIYDKLTNNYEKVYIDILLPKHNLQKKIFEIGTSNEGVEILCYINKFRALEDIYLIDDKASGIFNQYELDGSLCGTIEYRKGKIHGLSKTFLNEILVEESQYKNNQKCGICKIYKENQIIYEYWDRIKKEHWIENLILNNNVLQKIT